MIRTRSLRPFLSTLLALSVAVHPVVPAFARVGAEPTIRVYETPSKLQQKMNGFLAAMAKAQFEDPDALPPRLDEKESNLFGLRTQTILIPTEQGILSYRLGDALLALPTPSVSNIATQVTMEIQDGDLLIQHNSSKITQKIAGFNFVSLAQDEQFVFLLTKSGEVHAISNRFLKKFLFQAPVPVIKVDNVELPEGAPATIGVVSEATGPTQLSQGLQEEMILDEDQKAAFTKRDVFVNAGETTIKVMDRADLLDDYSMSAKFLALLCYQNNPRFYETDKVLRELLDQNPEHLDKMQAMLDDPAVQEALNSDETFRVLSSLPPYALKDLNNYLIEISDLLKNGEQRKRILIDELRARVDQEIQRAPIAEEKKQAQNKMIQQFARAGKQLKSDFNDFLGKTNALIEKTMTKETLTNVAIGLGVLGSAVTLDHVSGNHFAAWALDFGAKFFPVWSSAETAIPTAKALGALMLAPYVYEATGYLGGLITGVGSKSAFLAKASFQIYGLMAGYFQAATWLMGIKNFMPAARRGINPFRGMTTPFASNKKQAESRRGLEKNILSDLRIDNAAWMLAHSEVIDEDGLDPVAVAEAEIELARNRAAAAGVLERKASAAASLEESEELSQLAMGLRSAVKDLAKKDVAAKGKISQEKLLGLIENAKKLRKELKENSRLWTAVKRLGQKTQRLFTKKLPRGFGVFASESFRDLFYAEANESLMNQNFRIFRYAFIAELLLSSVIGPYADPSHPAQLLANGQGFLGFNPSFLAQQLQGILFLVIANPARMFLDFALAKDPSSASPSNDQLIYPKQERKAGYFETAKSYFKNLRNPVKMNMGYYALRHLKKSWLMILPGITMAILVRSGVLGQSIDQAVVGEIYRMIAAYLAYGWLWGLETRSLTLLEQDTFKLAAEERDAEFRINQGLRENNKEMIKQGITRLVAVFRASNREALVEDVEAIPNDKLEAIADQLLRAESEKSVRPSHPNELFMRTVTVSAAVFGSHLSNEFFAMAYSSTDTLWQMLLTLAGGVGTAGVAYSAIWAVQTAINKTHALLQEAKQLRAETGDEARSLLSYCRDLLDYRAASRSNFEERGPKDVGKSK